MKVLAVIGSPRKKGNTWRVVEKVKTYLLAMRSDIDFETLFLSECNVQMCTGCFTCFSRGKEKCPLQDDRDIIEAKMLEADGIILAAPTYAMGVPAIMKNLIDRFAYTCHRPFLFNKAVLLVSTVGGFMGLKETLNQLTMLVSGCTSIKKLGVPCPPIPMAGFEKRAEKKIKKASKDFLRFMNHPVPKAPGLADWAYFSSFKAFTSFEAYQKAVPADDEYYKDKEYFYPIREYPFSRFLGKTMKSLMKFSMGFLVKK
ncbi:MAG: NAD(P)H-dependent oxidoreductase [Clostridiales bacterium]|nr:NAD(P)H-dependent oxidoreductase [Clostridiales bacterium]